MSGHLRVFGLDGLVLGFAVVEQVLGVGYLALILPFHDVMLEQVGLSTNAAIYKASQSHLQVS